jgi:hypothetical protein
VLIEALFLSTTKVYICSAFMTWAGFKSLNDISPQNIKLPSPDSAKEEKKEYLEEVGGKFVDEYVMVELDAEKVIRKGEYIIYCCLILRDRIQYDYLFSLSVHTRIAVHEMHAG